MKKCKVVLLYIIFGIFTTIVNVVVYGLAAYKAHMPTVFSAVIAWIMAVLFAYVTNRKWVFHSDAANHKEICAEIMNFFGARLTTGIVDWMCMWYFVDILRINDIFIKLACNILVIILNYLASVFFVFKKKNLQDDL